MNAIGIANAVDRKEPDVPASVYCRACGRSEAGVALTEASKMSSLAELRMTLSPTEIGFDERADIGIRSWSDQMHRRRRLLGVVPHSNSSSSGIA